jgi:hypothetical protein
VLIGVARGGVVVRRLTRQAVRGGTVRPTFGPRLVGVVLGGIAWVLTLWV